MDQLQADQGLVRTLFYNDSQASLQGLRADAEFVAANNHPDFGYTADECYSMLKKLGLTDAYNNTSVPDVAAMAPDPTWALSAGSGRYAGMVPTGRVYILPVTTTQLDPNAGLNYTATNQVHVAVLDNRAYYFISCDRA
jgi:ABC-type Fe3+ transport system substrate-binding protein